MNLLDTEEFIKKVYQLHDTMEVRHGIMIVGPTGSGKSSNYRVLEKAITRLQPQSNQTEEQIASNPYRRVVVRTLNPKSILNEQL